MADIPVYLRFGDLAEECIGTVTTEPSDSGLTVQTEIANLLTGVAGVVRDVADIAHSQDVIRGHGAGTAVLPHDATFVRQYEQGPPEDGWQTLFSTGLICLVCNCGTVTGWVPKERASDLMAAHPTRRGVATDDGVPAGTRITDDLASVVLGAE